MMTVTVLGSVIETKLLFFRVTFPLMSASHGVLSSVKESKHAIDLNCIALKNMVLLLEEATLSRPNKTPPNNTIIIIILSQLHL